MYNFANTRKGIESPSLALLIVAGPHQIPVRELKVEELIDEPGGRDGGKYP